MGNIPLTPAWNLADDCREVELLIRPECVQLRDDGQGTSVQVVRMRFCGSRKLYTVRLPSGATLCGQFAPEVSLRTGEHVRITCDPGQLIAFPRAPGRTAMSGIVEPLA
jgi:ABC-type sugar transport system ATPase subunit